MAAGCSVGRCVLYHCASEFDLAHDLLSGQSKQIHGHRDLDGDSSCSPIGDSAYSTLGLWASLILSRLLYRTMGGGDGDDARHIASQALLLAAPISVCVYVLLVAVMYFYLPHALLYLIIPIWFLARDIFIFRSWKMTATTPGGRQAFFQALTCMTLDILSRSLRRSSFYRIVNLLVVVQLIIFFFTIYIASGFVGSAKIPKLGMDLCCCLGG